MRVIVCVFTGVKVTDPHKTPALDGPVDPPGVRVGAHMDAHDNHYCSQD